MAHFTLELAEWQPLESAPRDGTEIQVRFADRPDHYFDVAWKDGFWVGPGGAGVRFVAAGRFAPSDWRKKP